MSLKKEPERDKYSSEAPDLKFTQNSRDKNGREKGEQC
jgi:hypothetical protein